MKRINYRILDEIKNADLIILNKESLSDEPSIQGRMVDIHHLISEMIAVIGDVDIQDGFANQIDQFMERWLSLYRQFFGYDLVKDSKENFGLKKSLVVSLNAWYDSIINGFVREQTGVIVPYNFLEIYNWSKNHQVRFDRQVENISNIVSNGIEASNISKEKEELQKLIAQAKEDVNNIKSQSESSTTIVSELRAKASEETLHDYSIIFNAESKKHSSFRIYWDENELFKLPLKFEIGASQWWLLMGIILTLLFGYSIFGGKLNSLLPVIPNDKLLVSQIITRLLTISIWIYLITFSFKQYSINMHLSTINRHRSNALNSYKLFTESIERSDTSARNALMLNVAKAIYEQGQTGYLAANNKDNTSIIEMTRMIGQSEKP